ncbi:putative membrane protein [Lipingzhangella halophila]|uniref:Putative membrane protein n=1 Tax=Lipingzhangella halophila TaxID=1783352 RepID=A0A7W7RMB9_9ACTN|nr:pilus assembly protein TadG-related protein [Lipingzhangella halophila]MBB4934402.1 putative membrane protein [Lipingzhangella halophila]
MTHPRDERGHVSAFMTAIMTAVIAAMGLVWDAGGMLIQRGQASSIAHEAARAGANEIDLAHFRSTGQRRLDETAAAQAARAHLRTSQASGQVEVTTEAITVTARRPYSSVLLPVGTRMAEARSTAAARAP